MIKPLLTAALLTTWASMASAQVDITDAWVRATVQGQKATGAFMKITAKENAKLIAGSSPAAGVVEIHEMTLENDIMKMRQIPGLDLAAGRVDVVFSDSLAVAGGFLKKPQGKGFAFFGPSYTDEKYFGTGAGIGLRKGNDALLKRIEEHRLANVRIVHHDAVEPLGIVVQRHVAACRLARGAGHHHHHGTGRHEPVGNGLFDVLQGFAREQGAGGVGVLKAGRQTNLEAAGGDLPSLYRLRAFVSAGIPLAGGSDAPFGSPDPWAASAAAVSRTTASGLHLGPEEALTPEQAISLFLADPIDITRQRCIEIGSGADLCLLDRPWAAARLRLSADDVKMTIAKGRVIHNRVDKIPL